MTEADTQDQPAATPASIHDPIPAPMILAWFYALLPVIGGIIWLAAGADSKLRTSGMPIDMLPVISLIALIAALRAQLSRHNFLRLPSIWDRSALILFLAITAYGLAFVAVDPMHGVAELGERALTVLTAALLSFLIYRAGQKFESGLNWAVFLHVVLHLPILAVFYVYFIDDPRLNWKGGPIGFWHVRIWGMFLAVGIVMGVGLILRSETATRKIVLWALVAVLIGLLFWSGSRASALGMIGSLVFATVLFPKRMLPVWPPLALAAAVGIALSFVPEIPNSTYGILNSLAETVESENLDGTSGGRLTMWRDALTLVEQRPLLGHGFDQYRFVNFGRFEWALQPHNEVINMLVQSGVIGLFLIAFLMFRFWLKGYLRIRRSMSVARMGAFMGLNTLLIISLFDGSLYHPEPLMLAAILSAILLQPGADMDSPDASQYDPPKPETKGAVDAQDQRQ